MLFSVCESCISECKEERKSKRKREEELAVEEAMFGSSKVVCNHFVKYRIEISKVVKCLLPFSSISFLILYVFSIILIILCLV